MVEIGIGFHVLFGSWVYGVPFKTQNILIPQLLRKYGEGLQSGIFS